MANSNSLAPIVFKSFVFWVMTASHHIVIALDGPAAILACTVPMSSYMAPAGFNFACVKVPSIYYSFFPAIAYTSIPGIRSTTDSISTLNAWLIKLLVQLPLIAFSTPTPTAYATCLWFDGFVCDEPCKQALRMYLAPSFPSRRGFLFR